MQTWQNWQQILKLLTTLFCISGIFILFIAVVGLITNQITRTTSYTILLIIGIFRAYFRGWEINVGSFIY